jgi:hypothetical protein
MIRTVGTAEDAGVLAGIGVWIAPTFPPRGNQEEAANAVFEASVASRDLRFEAGFKHIPIVAGFERFGDALLDQQQGDPILAI